MAEDRTLGLLPVPLVDDLRVLFNDYPGSTLKVGAKSNF